MTSFAPRTSGGSEWTFGRMTKYSDRFDELSEWVLEATTCFGEALAPVLREIVSLIAEFCIHWRRTMLRQSLSRWMPDRLAAFVASRCPECWLPRLRWENHAL